MQRTITAIIEGIWLGGVWGLLRQTSLRSKCPDQSPIFTVYADPFIKVVLLFDGKKVKKKKTSIRKKENNPVYNECMMFDVPPDLLYRVLFVISVADSKADSSRSDVIGRVVVGSASTGEPLRHWHQMLISPRRPVAAWHRLRL